MVSIVYMDLRTFQEGVVFYSIVLGPFPTAFAWPGDLERLGGGCQVGLPLWFDAQETSGIGGA